MNSVPLPILSIILDLLPISKIYIYLQVCKLWNEIISKSERWKKFLLIIPEKKPTQRIDLFEPIYSEDIEEWKVIKLDLKTIVTEPFILQNIEVFGFAFRKVVRSRNSVDRVFMYGGYKIEQELETQYEIFENDVFIDSGRYGYMKSWISRDYRLANYLTLLTLENMIPLRHKRGFKAFYVLMNEYSTQGRFEKKIHVIVQINYEK